MAYRIRVACRYKMTKIHIFVEISKCFHGNHVEISKCCASAASSISQPQTTKKEK